MEYGAGAKLDSERAEPMVVFGESKGSSLHKILLLK